MFVLAQPFVAPPAFGFGAPVVVEFGLRRSPTAMLQRRARVRVIAAFQALLWAYWDRSVVKTSEHARRKQ